MSVTSIEMAVQTIVKRAEERYQAHRDQVYRATDRLLAALMACQWVFAVFLAVTLSPYAWEGKVRTVHMHVWTALVLGGILTSLPVALAVWRPGWVVTRHVMAAAQMLWSALLIHLTGGRIETHFHVFGSLGFLAAYRDWPVLITATVVVAADHLVRGMAWPESVYGIVNPEWWRFLEHAGWVVFAISFLIITCLRASREMRMLAEKGAELEALSEGEWRKSSVLDRAEAEAATPTALAS
jgi:hypothetical protein